MVTLSQPLSYQDQQELYKSTNSTTFVDPYDGFVDPRKQKSLAATWEKFKKLCDMMVVYDKHRSNRISLEELVTFTKAVGLAEVAPSFARLFSKIEADKNGKYEFDRCMRGLQKINYPRMNQLPSVEYKTREAKIAPTQFRGVMETDDPELLGSVAARLGDIFRDLNVALLMLDENKTGYVSKKEIKLLLKAFNLQDGRSSYVTARCDHNGKKGLAYVSLIQQLAKADYPSVSDSLPTPIGPNPVTRHKAVVKAMTARSNYSGSLTSGSSRGSVTNRSSDTNTSLASYMSGASGAGGNSLQTGRWPGHRVMTYSSQGSYRSQRTGLVPSLPELPVMVGGGGGGGGSLRKGDLDGLSEGGLSRYSQASSTRTGRTMKFSKKSPVKGGLKFSFNHKKIGQMKYGEMYRSLNDGFLRMDSGGDGYLTKEEIRGACVRLGMEAFEDVMEQCSLSRDGERISYVDFNNALKQKWEPGMPSVYSGAPRRPGRNDGRRTERTNGGSRRVVEVGGGAGGENFDSTGGSPERVPGGGSGYDSSPVRVAAMGGIGLDGVAAFAHEFGLLDKSGSGKMAPGEVRSVCRKFQGLSDEDLDKVMMRCSVDEAGKINYIEFVNVLKGFVLSSNGSAAVTSESPQKTMSGPPQVGMTSPPPLRSSPSPLASPLLLQKVRSKYSSLLKSFSHCDPSHSGFLPEREIRRLCGVYQVPYRVTEKAMAMTDVERMDVSYTEFSNNIMRVELSKLKSMEE